MRIEKVQYKIALIFGLFEAIALFFVALLGLDMTLQGSLISKFAGGFLTGVLTAFFAILIINMVNFKELEKIGILAPSFFNGLFLAVLFTIESWLSPVKSIGVIAGNAIASLTTPISILIILVIYDNFFLKFYFISKRKRFISKISVFPVVLFALIYEIMFLPSFAFFSRNISNKMLFYPLTAFIFALFSALISIYSYNNLPKELKASLVFS